MFASRVLVLIVLKRWAYLDGMIPQVNEPRHACGNTFGNVSLSTKTRRLPVLTMVLRVLRCTAGHVRNSEAAAMALVFSKKLDTNDS